MRELSFSCRVHFKDVFQVRGLYSPSKFTVIPQKGGIKKKPLQLQGLQPKFFIDNCKCQDIGILQLRIACMLDFDRTAKFVEVDNLRNQVPRRVDLHMSQ